MGWLSWRRPSFFWFHFDDHISLILVGYYYFDDDIFWWWWRKIIVYFFVTDICAQYFRNQWRWQWLDHFWGGDNVNQSTTKMKGKKRMEKCRKSLFIQMILSVIRIDSIRMFSGPCPRIDLWLFRDSNFFT